MGGRMCRALWTILALLLVFVKMAFEIANKQLGILSLKFREDLGCDTNLKVIIVCVEFKALKFGEIKGIRKEKFTAIFILFIE